MTNPNASSPYPTVRGVQPDINVRGIDPDLPNIDIGPLTVAELSEIEARRRHMERVVDEMLADRRWNAAVEGPMPEYVERKHFMRALYFAIPGWVIATVFIIYHGGNWLAAKFFL